MSIHKEHKRIYITILKINVAVFILEFLIALTSGSLVMLSDSFHVFIHIFASFIASVSESDFLNIASDKIKKYAALINVGLFLISAGIILQEAFERMIHPLELEIGWLYFIIAFLGLIANIYGARLIHSIKDHQCVLNMDTLYSCLAYDAASSVIVIFGAIVILLTGIFIIDPILSIALVGLMIWRGCRLLYQILNS